MRPDSQCGRVLRALADGKPHTVPDIHRRAGSMRLNSRVAELRARGYLISCTTGPGKGAARFRYVLHEIPLDAPAFVADLITEAHQPHQEAFALEADDHAPRDTEQRFEIYRLTNDDERELVATCASKEAVGVAVCTLGAEGEFERASLGILDTHAEAGSRWLLNPWDPRTR